MIVAIIFSHICDQICKNLPNLQLFQNEIEARKVDAIITVVINKKRFLKE